MSAFVIVESPFAGETDHDGPGSIAYNLRYVRACMRDCILRGEAPFASHALYTQPGVLRDEVPEERELGMGLGWHVAKHANHVAIYTDLGWSSGMVRGYNAAVQNNKPVQLRRLGNQWSTFEPGINYARVSGTEFVPPEARSPFFRITDNLSPTGESKEMFIEIDTKQGYGVAYLQGSGMLTGRVEVIKAPGRFGISHNKD